MENSNINWTDHTWNPVGWQTAGNKLRALGEDEASLSHGHD